jgi:hypothetical protein
MCGVKIKDAGKEIKKRGLTPPFLSLSKIISG